MKVGILGGVFNPPHLGHLLIAQQVLDFAGLDEVWFLPNYGQQPPKPGVAPVEHRLKMTQLLKLPRTRVSTLEIDHKLNGNTITLLSHLPKEHQFVFIIGADWLPRLTQWGRWEELLEKLPFLAFPRNGYPNEPLYKNMTLLQHELLMTSNISAIKIRERVKRGLPIDQFVTKEVARYITKYKLYK